KEIM
ncbi:hypothetical protein CLOP_g5517, partial [Closterium sp. NIES-67]